MKRLLIITLLLTLPALVFALPTAQQIRGHGILTAKLVAETYQQAEQGNVFAQANLGEALINGSIGVLPNYEGAAYWLHRAERLCKKSRPPRVGCALTYANLAMLYFQGYGVPQSRAKYYAYNHAALKAYNQERSKYSDYERATTNFSIANMYFWGVHEVVKQNLRKAFTLYKESAELGFVHSIQKVALMYHYGLGVKQNINEALAWYQVLANAGSPEAQYMVGIYYIYGSDGIKKNVKEGAKWIDKASVAGYYPAIVEYIQLEQQGLAPATSETQKSITFILKNISDNMSNVLQRYPVMKI